MKNALSLFLVLCALSMVQAQKEAAHWYFGQHAGLDFSTGAMTIDAQSNMEAMHGCAVANDENGNLLFYTNGAKVWNRTHQVMQNGSLGESCISIYDLQNCAIVPKIGANNQFYALTIRDAPGGYKGLSYNIVDLSYNNGLGRVTQTCVPLIDSLIGGCAVTLHANETDYWVVVQGMTWISGIRYERWHSFLVDENGINLVATKVGDRFFTPQKTAKFSPNGEMFFCGYKVFDFNKATGELLSYRRLYGSDFVTYGHGEFSPNNQVLYVLNSGSTGFTLDQYDLTLPELGNTQVALDLETDGQVLIKGSLQLGPDGKLYVSYLGNIGVINQPNLVGIDCDLQQDFIYCGGPSGWTFPNFSSHLFREMSPSTADQEHNKDTMVKIYPNPARGYLHVQQELQEYTSYELLDVNAKILDQGNITGNNARIDVSRFAAGVYMLRLNTVQSGSINKKIIFF